MKASAWQAQETLKLLRMILNRAVDAELIVRNPAVRIAAPRTERRELVVLTPTQVGSLADAVPAEWRAFVLLAAYSSLRFSELVALRVDRVDFLRRQVRVEEKIVEVAGRFVRGEPKTKESRRVVALPSLVVEALAEHVRWFPPSQDGLVFHGAEGGPVHRPHFYRRVWGPATKACGLEGFPFRNLRHTGASLAIAAGADLKAVSGRLGHTTIRMTADTYVGMFEARDRDVADRLDAMARNVEGLPTGSDPLTMDVSRTADGMETG
jgi:integrase